MRLASVAALFYFISIPITVFSGGGTSGDEGSEARPPSSTDLWSIEFNTSSTSHSLPGFFVRGTDLGTFANKSSVPLHECFPCPPGMHCRGDKIQGMSVPGNFCGGGASRPAPPPRWALESTLASTRWTDLDTVANKSYVPLHECFPCPPGMHCRDDKIQSMCFPASFCGGGASRSTPPPRWAHELTLASTRWTDLDTLANKSSVPLHECIPGAHECFPCPPGMHCRDDKIQGMCFPGSFCGGGSSRPAPPPRWALESTLASTRWTDLDTVANKSSVPLHECFPCPPGMHCRDDKIQGMCFPGSFCGGGASRPAPPQSELMPEYGGNSIAKSGPCPDGYYCPLASSTPIQCPAGTYEPTMRRSSVYECETCLNGFYIPVASSSPRPCLGDTHHPEEPAEAGYTLDITAGNASSGGVHCGNIQTTSESVADDASGSREDSDAASAPSPSKDTFDASSTDLSTSLARVLALLALVLTLVEIAALLMQLVALARSAMNTVVALARALAPALCYSPWCDLMKIGAIMETTLRFTIHATRRVSTRGCVAVVRMVAAGALVFRSIGNFVKVTVVSVYLGMLAISPVVARGARAVLGGVYAGGKWTILMTSKMVGLSLEFAYKAIVAMLWATKTFYAASYAAFYAAFQAIRKGPHPAINIFLEIFDTPAPEATTAFPLNPLATLGRGPSSGPLASRNRGMINQGNACWMLSTVQFINAMPKLRALLVAYVQQATQNGDQPGALEHVGQASPTHRVLVALGKVLQELPVAKGAQDIDLGELDDAWRGLFGWEEASQQDATEAMCAIFNCLDEAYPSTKDAQGRSSNPHETLSFMTSGVKEFTQCNDCGRVSTTENFQRGIHCPLLQDREGISETALMIERRRRDALKKARCDYDKIHAAELDFLSRSKNLDADKESLLRHGQSSKSEVQFCMEMEYGAQETYGEWKCVGCRQDKVEVVGNGQDAKGKLAMLSRKSKLTTAPSELVVCLRRHAYDAFNWAPRKISRRASFPLDDLILPVYTNSSTFDDEPTSEVLYMCTAVVQHLGDSFAHGHYITLTRETADPRSDWLEYNDSSVRAVPRSDVVTEHAYMLVFRREDTVA